MTKIRLIFLLVLLFLTIHVFAAQPQTIYISPNNDGIQDNLIVPLSISDKRYITEWVLVIKDQNDTVIRTIGNKEKRPEKMTPKVFWDLLTKAKEGVVVPKQIIWNGTADSGETAADGTYKYYVTATDDNGNVSKTPEYTVIVKNTPPKIMLTQVTGTNLIFGPGGDGNKTAFPVKQSGSSEDKWVGQFIDVSGKPVKTIEWQNSTPHDFAWDGKTDNGIIAFDGVYTYKISATDRAGNTVSGEINNIILDTVRPSINLTIDSNYFSPAGNSTKKTLQLTPSMPIVSGLSGWKIEILDKNKKSVRSYNGNTKPAPIVFDGKDNSGNNLPEGEYQATYTAQYVNGQEPQSFSPVFTIDNTAPNAQVKASAAIFAPGGENGHDSITFYQTGTSEALWQGAIIDSNGKTVKTYNFASTPATSIVWDGLTDSLTLASDGMYTYKLSATDRAGNTGFAESTPFELDTSKTELVFTSNKNAFSPVVMGQNTVVFTPTVKNNSRITEYTLVIADSTGNAVKTVKGTSLPRTLDWNGLDDNGVRAKDGVYTAKLETVSQNGSRASSSTAPFIMDSVAPIIEVSVPYTLFSTNESSKKQKLPISLKSSKEELWTAQITDSAQKPVRVYTWEGEAKPFEWDGTDEAGNPVPDGKYSFLVQTKDIAGNSATASIKEIVLDNRFPKAYVTAAETAFSPNGNGIKDVQKLNPTVSITDGISAWNVSIKRAGSRETIREWTQKDSAQIPATITWDGKSANGSIAEGNLYAEFTVEYAKGDEVKVVTPLFISSITPPELTVKTAPQYFSPDNDGVDDDLFIALSAKSAVPLASWSFEINDPQNGSSFWKTGGTSAISERMIWDGRSNKGELVQSATDYPFTFTVTDTLGMKSTVKGFIAVDVLVIKIGDVLKMQIPSIVFRENAADFEKLPADVVEKNNATLKRIAEILNKFKDYKVTIEGHANNVSGTAKEEAEELIPLSQARASSIKNVLVKLGVDANRLSIIGKGGTQPVASRDDRTNWWKNRRVEFILNK